VLPKVASCIDLHSVGMRASLSVQLVDVSSLRCNVA
jgi:hypothetical protein